MIDSSKPTIVVSRCLGFDSCRYNGDIIRDKFVKRLRDYVNYISPCPEVDIGLGTPRDSLRLVMEDDQVDIYQPNTGNTYTEEMEEYSLKFLDSLERVDGFILKGRSPSCGPKDVKIYMGREKGTSSIKGEGIFAAQVFKKYPYLPVEEEGRLTNYSIREHFLTKLYTFFSFSQIKDSNSMKELVKFHSNNKHLLMTYSQNQLKILGRIVANHEKLEFSQLIKEYESNLGIAFEEIPSRGNYINTFMHVFGYFSEFLKEKEKDFILDRFTKYREGKIHLSVLTNVLTTYVIKYDKEYLLDQTIWATYPEELLDISDSGK